MTDTLQIASNLIREGEGLRLTVYKDTVGKDTVGWGRNLKDKGLSYPEAELLLANDLLDAKTHLRTEFGFFAQLSPVRQAVFMDLYHNMGLQGLLSFKKMLRATQIGDFDEAAKQIRFTQVWDENKGEHITRNTKYWDDVGDRAKRNYCMMKFDMIFTKQEAKNHFNNE